MSLVQTRISELCASSEGLGKFLTRVADYGEIAVVGGAARDWFLDRNPRDVDLVVDVADERLGSIVGNRLRRRTRYGGYVLSFGQVSIDIWSLGTTWAFQRIPNCSRTFENLPKTAFFNLDAVAVSLSSGRVFEHGFEHALATKELSIVFQDNPYPQLCAARAMCLAKYYQMHLHDSVTRFVWNLVRQGLSWSDLERAQLDHYGSVRIGPNDVLKMLPANVGEALLTNRNPQNELT